MPKRTTKRKSSSNGYSGRLAEPIYLETGLALRIDPTGELEKAIKKQALSQLVSNLGELFKWYQVEIGTKDPWMHLYQRPRLLTHFGIPKSGKF